MSASTHSQLGHLLETTSTLTQVASALATLVAVYAVRRYLSPSPLDAIPGPPSHSYLTGHFKNIMFSKDGTEFCQSITEDYGEVVKLKVLFGGEMLYLSDPLALNHVLREVDVWPKASYLTAMNHLVFGPGLLASHGDAHRRQRKMLNPIFTAPYIRHLTPVLYTVAYQLRDAIRSQIGSSCQVVDMTKPLSQAALELMGQAGLGSNFGSLQGQPHIFAKASKDILPAIAGVGLALPLLPFLTRLGSPAFLRKVVELFSWPALRRVVQNVDDMEHTSAEIYQNKKNTLLSSDAGHMGSGEDAKDIITHLLRANSEASHEDRLLKAELVSQLTTLMFAGTDTTSTALAITFQLLATHQDIQDRLRTEILDARKANNNRDLDYQGIDELQLLSAVVRETLRLHAPVPHLPRVSTKDDVIPLRYPITSTDGKTQLKSIPVPKGTEVLVGIASANTSKQIWGPDATEWKPERWMNPLPQTLVNAKMPGVFPPTLTFSSGARSCIGYRLALQELKVVLCVLLESFKFELDADVEWHMSFLMVPYVVGNASEPQLPLKVQYIGD